MTDRHVSDDRLREAFQALGETADRQLSPEEMDRVWQAAAGELPAAERQELVDRMAADPALAEAWRAAQELRRGTAGEIRTARAWTKPAWLAAAAVLIVGVAAGIIVQRSGPRDGTLREAGTYVIESQVQQDAPLPREAFRLRWTPGPQDTRYQVTVTTEDLRVLKTALDLTMPEYTVDGQALSGVAPGGRVLWQVMATLPGGESVASQTFVVRAQ